MTFETTPGGDPRELADQLDLSQEMDLWTGLLLDIERQLYHLERLLTVIINEQVALCTEGIYPAVPTLFFDNDPLGQPRYAKLSLPRGTLDNGKRKIYIGCKPAKIQAAKAKIARTRRHEALGEERTRLERFLRMVRADLDRVARQVAHYRTPDDLGLELDVAVRDSGPKEWIRTRPVVRYDVEDMELPPCTCGMGDGSMPELHAEDCDIVRYIREKEES